MILPVVLSGGSGTRLWPMSRRDIPKQLQKLTSDLTMLQETLLRLESIKSELSDALVVASNSHADVIAAQLAEIDERARVILEPIGRNTAPAIAMAAQAAVQCGQPEAVLLVMPADHVISRPQQFCEHVLQGASAAAQGALVTFGVVPSAPHTGYGYIHSEQTDGLIRDVESFVEKPDIDTARQYLASGQHFWNSGIFMFRADVFLAELERFAPDVADGVTKSLYGVAVDSNKISPNEALFSEVRAESIDYAVMEKTSKAKVIPVDVGWSDVGSWPSLHEVLAKDQNGNSVTGDVIAIDTKNSVIKSSAHLIAVCGLSNVVIVETDSVILVASKDHAQQVKDVVEELKAKGRDSLY